MSINRNAAQLKSYDRLERETYRREERIGRWEMEDKLLLGQRPKRGALWLVNEELLATALFQQHVCMHCWTYIISTDVQVNYDNNALYGSQSVSVSLPDDPQWVHASSMHARCYRDAGSRATFMPGIYVIEEMGV